MQETKCCAKHSIFTKKNKKICANTVLREIVGLSLSLPPSLPLSLSQPKAHQD